MHKYYDSPVLFLLRLYEDDVQVHALLVRWGPKHQTYVGKWATNE